MRLMPESRRVAPSDAPSGELPKLLTIAALVATVAVAVLARMTLSSHAFLAVVATALFAFAAAATAAAWLMRRRAGARLGWLDLAGIFTCIGIVVSMMIEPEEVAQFVAGAPRSK
jgi:hypothetical protein